MDDGFSFRAAPVPLHRRVDLRVIKSVVAGVVVLVATTAFARWVIDSEHRSEAGAEAHLTSEPVVGMLHGTIVEDPADALPVLDAPARADAVTALKTARRAMHGKRTIQDAGPGQLSGIEASLVFTDGPSPAAGIVSVTTAGQRWAGAVMGASGTCYWVALTPAGSTFGSGELCTGLAALSAREVRWS